jgi:hypothetical protein
MNKRHIARQRNKLVLHLVAINIKINLGQNFFGAIFAPLYANKEIYKADQEATPNGGSRLIVLYFKIIEAFSRPGRLFDFKTKNEEIP